MTESDGAKTWVSIRIPETTRDKAKNDNRTYEEIMQDGLGIERSDPNAEKIAALVYEELDAKQIAEEFADKLENRLR